MNSCVDVRVLSVRYCVLYVFLCWSEIPLVLHTLSCSPETDGEEEEEEGRKEVGVDGEDDNDKEEELSDAMRVTNISCPPFSLKRENRFSFSFLALLGVSSYSSPSTSTSTLTSVL